MFKGAGANCLKPADNPSQVFGVELTRERGRTHEITKYDGKMPSFGVGLSRPQGFDRPVNGNSAAAVRSQAGAAIAAEACFRRALTAASGTN
jgi:hypothetical protein